MSCVETLEYSRLDVVVGQSVELLCNISLTSDIVWTYDSDDGYVDNVYWKGRIDREKPRLAVKFTGDNFHHLFISAVELNDSGLYDCYDGQGTRKVGYQVVFAGMCRDVKQKQ